LARSLERPELGSLSTVRRTMQVVRPKADRLISRRGWSPYQALSHALWIREGARAVAPRSGGAATHSVPLSARRRSPALDGARARPSIVAFATLSFRISKEFSSYFIFFQH